MDREDGILTGMMRSGDIRHQPRWFHGNFDFEHQLARPGSTPSQQLVRLNAELAISWLAVAQDGDVIHTPLPLEFDQETRDSAWLPKVKWTTEAPTADDHVVPWGWSASIGRPTCPLDVVRQVNSRRWSAALEEEWQVGLPEAGPAHNQAEVEARLQRIMSFTRRWVIKAEFGMSGRERLLGEGQLAANQQAWIRRRLIADGVVFVEPWVECVAEAGLQFEILPGGSLLEVGVAPMLRSLRGEYAGTLVHDASQNLTADWDPPLVIARRAVERLRDTGYVGPVGIDAMQYQCPDGSRHWRPLQDINARWTMGRLALGWRDRLPPTSLAYWWHGSRTAYLRGQHLERAGSYRARAMVIPTAPLLVDQSPARHASALVIVSRPQGAGDL